MLRGLRGALNWGCLESASRCEISLLMAAGQGGLPLWARLGIDLASVCAGMALGWGLCVATCPEYTDSPCPNVE